VRQGPEVETQRHRQQYHRAISADSEFSAENGSDIILPYVVHQLDPFSAGCCEHIVWVVLQAGAVGGRGSSRPPNVSRRRLQIHLACSIPACSVQIPIRRCFLPLPSSSLTLLLVTEKYASPSNRVHSDLGPPPCLLLDLSL
jgi:hypothetical protein